MEGVSGLRGALRRGGVPLASGVALRYPTICLLPFYLHEPISPAQLLPELRVHLGREQRREVELRHVEGRRERQVRHSLEALARRLALPVVGELYPSP